MISADPDDDFEDNWQRYIRNMAARIETLEKALMKIEKWHGEFPETGEFWLNEDGTLSDRPMSYSAAFGSNGERDYMRNVAREALLKAGK